jgi:hypothetical protein
MSSVLSLGAFVIVVFVIMLKPDVIKAVHAPNKPKYCNIGHSSAQECGSNVLAAVPGQQRQVVPRPERG